VLVRAKCPRLNSESIERKEETMKTKTNLKAGSLYDKCAKGTHYTEATIVS